MIGLILGWVLWAILIVGILTLGYAIYEDETR